MNILIFPSAKELFLKSFLDKFEECYTEWIPVWIEYWKWIRFEDYSIYLNTWDYWVHRWELFINWKSIIKSYHNEKEIWFFEQILTILKKNSDRIEKEKQRKLKEEKRIYEESMGLKYMEYIDNLNWIVKPEWTKEFDEVVQDTKRLQEIAKEANQIHNKYKKKFLWLF